MTAFSKRDRKAALVGERMYLVQFHAEAGGASELQFVDCAALVRPRIASVFSQNQEFRSASVTHRDTLLFTVDRDGAERAEHAA